MSEGGEISSEDARAFESVLGVEGPQLVGGFRFWFEDQRWEWSDEVAKMHGYAPGSVRPTTELLLAHKHSDDREQVAGTIARSVENAEAFCSRHRIVDTVGQVHDVLVVGDQMLDGGGRVVGTAGYYMDMTDTFAAHSQETLADRLPELYAARAVVEQAKGALMLVYGISAEQAFGILAWRSQDTNVKLRLLATQLVAELPSIADSSAGLRTRFDHLLLTAHERIQPARCVQGD
ncbi:PAS and ANTAR domain-containing protein [Nocardia tengchongensis]|uniref:PAS and ANTAR domain-containing protein n=1 Tax=Nocardia tengchongensis TaxID=2055889 RepID=UPI0036736754